MTYQDLEDLYAMARSAPIIADKHKEVGDLFARVEAHLNKARLDALQAAQNKTVAE